MAAPVERRRSLIRRWRERRQGLEVDVPALLDRVRLVGLGAPLIRIVGSEPTPVGQIIPLSPTRDFTIMATGPMQLREIPAHAQTPASSLQDYAVRYSGQFFSSVQGACAQFLTLPLRINETVLNSADRNHTGAFRDAIAQVHKQIQTRERVQELTAGLLVGLIPSEVDNGLGEREAERVAVTARTVDVLARELWLRRLL